MQPFKKGFIMKLCIVWKIETMGWFGKIQSYELYWLGEKNLKIIAFKYYFTIDLFKENTVNDFKLDKTKTIFASKTI